METQKSNKKLKAIQEIEKKVKERWKREKCFESNPCKGKPKYMVTFPYPYMNGLAHLGHMFSLSKCEFAISFHRMMGENCLFPLGFHCTGMPIKVSCDRLKMELSEGVNVIEKEETNRELIVDPEKELENRMKSSRSKAASKTIGKSTQYEVIRDATQLDDVSEFTNPHKWIEYFPKEWINDLDQFGAKIDWRRSFITTDANPFYDSFVGWFMSKLGKYIHFGKRHTIYSPKDEQPCMDHDRSSGEGLSYTEFTLIKYKMEDGSFLIAATRRPETMLGQVCCWVHPKMEYVKFTLNEATYISSKHAVRNIQHQFDNVVVGETIHGGELIGKTVQLPFSDKIVPVLPLVKVKDDMGTGIVACVPSDSPDDYIALVNAKVDIQPIPVVSVAELGTLSAPTLCKQFGIKSINDTQQLAKASQLAYSRGFNEGVMLDGKYAGMKVQDARPLIKEDMIRDGIAMNYAEPEGRIVSRSGDVCVVCLCDQWYIDYGNEEWKSVVRELLSRLKLSDEIRNNFSQTIDKLHEHAMSRSYGLGTRVPWDPKYLIESLSDSTVYNAFYPVSYLLQGNLDGSVLGPFGIKPHQMEHAVWDYIYYDKAPFPENCSIEKAHLDTMKAEFNYWYPVDMRSSGKDLIQNHLTYYLYTHIAVWPDEPEKWPISIRANGLLLLNNQKMSKSTGNFMTLRDACNMFSSDATRLTLADAGDSIDDANFSMQTANATLLRIYSFLEFCTQVLSKPTTYIPYNIIDQAFLSSMHAKVEQTYIHYYNGNYKDAIKIGFYDMMNLRDIYMSIAHNPALIVKFIKIQTLMLSPVCPHVCDYIWTELLHSPSSIVNAQWNSQMIKIFPLQLPKLDGVFPYINSVLKSFSKAYESAKRKKRIGYAVIWVADKYTHWQYTAMNVVREMIAQTGVADNAQISRRLNEISELSPYSKKLMPFVASQMDNIKSETEMIHRDFDEYAVLTASLRYFKERLKIQNLIVRRMSEDNYSCDRCYPNNPVIVFDHKEYCHVRFINRDRCCGFFEEKMIVFNEDSSAILAKRMNTQLCLVDKQVNLFTVDGVPITDESIFHVLDGQLTLSSKVLQSLVYSVC